MVKPTLRGVEEFLSREGVPVRLVGGDHLVISAGAQLELSLYLNPKRLAEEPGAATANFILFYLEFPFKVKEGAFSDLARFLMALNKTLEFPGFYLSESDHTVYYRYDLYVGSALDPNLLKGVIGYAMYMVDAHVERIKQAT